MKSGKIIGILSAVIGALLVIGPWTFVHVCKGMEGMESPCHTTRLYITVLGIIVILMGMIVYMAGASAIKRIFSILLAACGVIGILTPTALAPVCKMADMHCRTHTMPYIIVMSIVLIVVSVIGFITMKKKTPELSFAGGIANNYADASENSNNDSADEEEQADSSN